MSFTCLRYKKKLEYCPASERYDRKTVTHMRSTVVSLPTFLKDCGNKEKEQNVPQIKP